MEDRDELRRTFSRVNDFAAFAPDQRIWWIYLRNAAGTWLESNEDADLRRAFDSVKAFPENLPDEPRRWHELRQAVAAVLDGD
jgi:hypothetical protein